MAGKPTKPDRSGLAGGSEDPLTRTADNSAGASMIWMISTTWTTWTT